jgi:hypothetical protein
MKRRFCDKGAAGIFEDLPAFLVVLIALGIFIASIFFSTVNYIKTWEYNERYEECLELLEALKQYDGLLITGKATSQPMTGVYSIQKLNDMNSSVMRTDILSEHHYNISIVSLKDKSLNWKFGDELESEGTERTTMFTTIIIEVNQNELHTGHLRVTIW